MVLRKQWRGMVGLGAVVAGVGAAGLAPSPAAPKDFSIEGYYVEACSCRMPCPCELTGIMNGCKGVGLYHITKGTYDGADFSGAELAYTLELGDRVLVYVDAPDAKTEAAATAFARAAFAAFGPVKSVKNATIEISGADGTYTATVDGGKVMRLETEPVLGGDKKTPIVHTNTNGVLNSTMYQGSCVSCTADDQGVSFTLEKGRNVYFNAKVKSNGKI